MQFSSLFSTLITLGLLLLPSASSASHWFPPHSVFVIGGLIVFMVLIGLYLFQDTFLRLVAFGVVGVCCLQAQWGVAQFILQGDLGLHVLGETRLSVAKAGVATFKVEGEKIVRAYGPYPHANSFGGAMVVGLMLLFLLRGRKAGLSDVLGFVIFFGMLVSFSRSAYAALALTFTVLFILGKLQVRQSFMTTLIAVFVFMPLLVARNADSEDMAAVDRVVGWRAAQEIISRQPVWRGVGWGQYPKALREYFDDVGFSYDPWDIAPVHSVPLLLVTELGLIAAGTGLLAAAWLYGKYASGVALPSVTTLAALLPMILLDHYLVTQPVTLTLAVVLALLVPPLLRRG